MAVERWTDEMLDELAELAARNLETATKNPEAAAKNSEAAAKNLEAIQELREESKELNIRFNAYQQTSQWVVNLAFGLLATATITTIVSAVIRK